MKMISVALSCNGEEAMKEKHGAISNVKGNENETINENNEIIMK